MAPTAVRGMVGLRAPIYRGRARWPGKIQHDGGAGCVFGRLCLEFLLDGREGAEELVGDVSQDGGAARGDAVLREMDEERGEEVIDLRGGFEGGGVCGKNGAEAVIERGGTRLGEVPIGRGEAPRGRGEARGVAETVRGAGVLDGETAAAAGGRVVLAAGQVLLGVTVSRFLGHKAP